MPLPSLWTQVQAVSVWVKIISLPGLAWTSDSRCLIQVGRGRGGRLSARNVGGVWSGGTLYVDGERFPTVDFNTIPTDRSNHVYLSFNCLTLFLA